MEGIVSERYNLSEQIASIEHRMKRHVDFNQIQALIDQLASMQVEFKAVATNSATPPDGVEVSAWTNMKA